MSSPFVKVIINTATVIVFCVMTVVLGIFCHYEYWHLAAEQQLREKTDNIGYHQPSVSSLWKGVGRRYNISFEASEPYGFFFGDRVFTSHPGQLSKAGWVIGVHPLLKCLSVAWDTFPFWEKCTCESPEKGCPEGLRLLHRPEGTQKMVMERKTEQHHSDEPLFMIETDILNAVNEVVEQQKHMLRTTVITQLGMKKGEFLADRWVSDEIELPDIYFGEDTVVEYLSEGMEFKKLTIEPHCWCWTPFTNQRYGCDSSDVHPPNPKKFCEIHIKKN